MIKRLRSPHHQNILLLLAVVIIQIVLTDTIDRTAPEFVKNDLHKYRAIALNAPEFDANIECPFIYRPGIPYAIGLIWNDIDNGFFVVNSALLLLLAALFYRVIADLLKSNTVALIAALAFIANRYFFSFLVFDPYQVTDTLSMVLILAGFLTLREKRYSAYFFILLLGLVTRETVMLLIPYSLLLWYFSKESRTYLFRIGLISAVILVLFFGYRALLPCAVGNSLFQQLAIGMNKLFMPQLLIKQLIIAFTPFGLIAFLFGRTFGRFVKANPALTIFSLLAFVSTFFGLDAERLMLPVSILFYAFLGRQISVHSPVPHWYWLVFGAFLLGGHLYHLWGMVLLPDRQVSLLWTLIINVLVAIFVWFLRKKKAGEAPA
jgi:hypothetical protein